MLFKSLILFGLRQLNNKGEAPWLELTLFSPVYWICKKQISKSFVTDCDLKKVIWVSEGNRKESLDQFFQILGKERCEKIKTVSKDLHVPYASSCAEYIPNAVEVADSFHVVKKLNETMDACRRELSVGSAIAISKRKIIQGLQWVMRYKQENLPERHLESLDQLSRVNEPLYKAYLHKESFYEFFNFRPSQVKEAENFLIGWIVEAFKSKLKALQEFCSGLNVETSKLLKVTFIAHSAS